MRLLANTIRIDDLTNLFLCTGGTCTSDALCEVSDFVVRSDVRIKNLVTETAKDWITVLQYQDWVRSNGRPADLSRRPPNTLAYLEASFRLADMAALLDQTGLEIGVAEQAMQILLKQFETNADGSLRFTGGTTTGAEYLLLSFLNMFNVFGTAFSGHQLFADLKSQLLRLGALERSEIAAFDRLQPVITLFALSKMHKVLLTTPASETRLMTNVVHRKVGMMVTIAGIPWGRVFEATLNAEQYCEPDLLSQPQPWECDIEVTPNLRLGRMI